MSERVEAFLDDLKTWAAQQPDVPAIAIVGSHVRGAARPDSDVDVILIVDEPACYLNESAWMKRFGQVLSVSHEDWGLVQSIRVHYADGMEVEFGITVRKWASTDPIDHGTKEVVSKGMRLLYDRDTLLESLMAVIT